MSGREIVHALVEQADIFVQNFRKGVAGRNGLDYESLKALNPQLIYASATGYGPNGPDSGEPSFDHLGLARSGIMNAVGEPDQPPSGVAGGVADQMGAIMLAYGILNALLAKERFGVGQEVNASHLGSMSYLQGLSLSMKLMAGMAMPRVFRARAYNPLWNHYCCGDGHWIALAMLQPDRYWADLTRLIGQPELASDPRFVDMGSRAAHGEECVALLDKAFGSRPREEWIRLFRDDDSDLIYTIVNSVDDLPDDIQMQTNGYIVQFDHPQFGATDMVGIPVELSETPGSIRSAAPELGQHTEEILMDRLGWDWEKISGLREREVI